MPLQDRIIDGYMPGVPGQKADNELSVYLGNCLAGTGVSVGKLVWVTGNVAAPTGAGVPTGLVERTITFPNYNIRSEATMAIPAGWEITVAIKGRYFFTGVATQATAGQKLFVKPGDGTVQTGAAGASITNFVETPWLVRVGGAIGEIIIIENF
jgi:hypothetical protein